MNGYALRDPLTLAAVASVLVVLWATGFLLTRGRSKWLRLPAWTLPVAAVVGIERLVVGEPAGVRMLSICAGLLYAMKAVVGVESRIAGKPPLSPLQWSAFVFGWFGMRPGPFAKLPSPPRDGVAGLLKKAGVAVGLGSIAITVGWGLGRTSLGGWPAVVSIVVGYSLLVHFALFDALAAFWRWLGVNVQKLFRAPLTSTSLAEFWGRRWNLAFSEMTALAVYRPLKGPLGGQAANVVAFLFSGLLHELAISVPARAGHGLPFAYFLLHAFAIRLESGPLAGRLESPVAGRVWTIAWLVLPLPLLLPPAFVRGVILPIVGVG